MDVILVVDMQVGLLDGPSKHDLAAVIDRINALTTHIRQSDGRVIWIRHCGGSKDGFKRGAPGWDFLPELIRDRDDRIIEKTLNDPFAGSTLRSYVASRQVRINHLI